MRKEFQLANNDILGINNPGLSDPNQLDIFLNKPFWIWDQKEHNIKFRETEGKCCHVDILGRPQKDNIDFPLFNFQKLIYDAIENNDSIWLLKARGIGLSTFMLYYLTSKILSSSDLDHESIFIISGTREEHANYLKEKMAQLFERNFPFLNLYTKYTEMILKNTWIKVFPSTLNSIKDIRGYFSAKYIWVDESDYIPENVIDELIAAITPYQTKSNAKIILSSTANKPNGLMQKIELDKNSKYFKIKLPYTYGLDTMYNRAEIEKKKNDIEFEREMNCKYLGKVGNLFTQQQLEMLTKLGNEYSISKIKPSLYTLKSIGVDPGYSSSATGIVVLEHIRPEDMKSKIRVLETYNIEKSTPTEITEISWNIWKKFNYMNCYFWVDASSAATVNTLKIRFNESLSWPDKTTFANNIHIRPVNFSTEHKTMLSNLHNVVTKSYLAIDEKHTNLLTSLRTAYAEELNLKKDLTSYSDLLDALRLALEGYNIQ